MAGPARAAGHPDYSSSGTAKFIPALWAGKLVEKFYPATVFGAIANTDYEGEIANLGDTVHIRTTPNITIRDYEIGGGLTYENPNSDAVELQIDQAKYFAFSINDVDKYQADIDLMDDWADDAGEQMKIAVDTSILGTIYGDVAAANAGDSAGAKSGNINLGATGAPVELTKDNIVDKIVELGQVLTEQNVPETGRWLVLPPWATTLIKTSDLKDASLAGDGTSILRNGRIGMIDRFTIYESNNMSVVEDTVDTTTVNVTNVVFGHKAGLTFASQMTQMEQIPNPDDFGQLVRGLNVYGYEVIEGKYLGHLYAMKAPPA